MNHEAKRTHFRTRLSISALIEPAHGLRPYLVCDDPSNFLCFLNKIHVIKVCYICYYYKDYLSLSSNLKNEKRIWQMVTRHRQVYYNRRSSFICIW